jgi:hypothetical protein
MSTNNPRRGRPPVDSDLVRFRAERRVIDAIDTFAAHQEPPASRPDAVRALVMKQLTKLGLLRPATPAQPATEAQMQASAAVVRAQAAVAVDEALSGSSATADQKAERRGALTDEPAADARRAR